LKFSKHSSDLKNPSSVFRVPSNAFSLILISAFCDSYLSYAVKYTFNKQGQINLSSFLAIVNYVTDMLVSPLIATGIIAFILAPIFWIMALKKTELSVAYPLSVACHLIFIFGFSFFSLQEAITTQKILGCSFLMISIFYLYRS
jgi:multidrug transporter EmrE-like cation transporter